MALAFISAALVVERLVANEWVASRVKAVSRRRRGPTARLYRACPPSYTPFLHARFERPVERSVALRNYPEFLSAFLKGQVTRLVVVER